MNSQDIRDTRIAALREVLERVNSAHDHWVDQQLRDEVREALQQDDKRACGEMDPLLDAGYAMVHGSTPIVVTKDGRRHVGITVRRDTLLPLLVLMKKFFLSLQGTNTGGATSRTVPSADFPMTFQTRGFTPADFNALQSLNWTVGSDLAAEIDATPEMGQMRNDAPKKPIMLSEDVYRRTLPAKTSRHERLKGGYVECATCHEPWPCSSNLEDANEKKFTPGHPVKCFDTCLWCFEKWPCPGSQEKK